MKPFEEFRLRIMQVPTLAPPGRVEELLSAFRRKEEAFKAAQAAYDRADPDSARAFWTASKEFSEAGLAICNLMYGHQGD